MINAIDPSGLCTLRTLETEASDEETRQCRSDIIILQSAYGINLAVKSGSFEDNWTTTRVSNVKQAMSTIATRVGGAGQVRRVFGNTTLSAGADVSGECATTENSTNIDWGSCSIDDPYSVFNIIHELGHVLQFRNDSYPSVLTDGTIAQTGEYNRPRETWERMLILSQPQPTQGFNYYTDRDSIFFDVQAGFATTGRQNIGQGGRNNDEEVADMFLFWIVPRLSFDLTSDAGRLRQRFVDGYSDENFEESGIPLRSLGMAVWVERAGNASVEASASISPTLVSIIAQIPSSECLDLPFMNTQFLV